MPLFGKILVRKHLIIETLNVQLKISHKLSICAIAVQLIFNHLWLACSLILISQRTLYSIYPNTKLL